MNLFICAGLSLPWFALRCILVLSDGHRGPFEDREFRIRQKPSFYDLVIMHYFYCDCHFDSSMAFYNKGYPD